MRRRISSITIYLSDLLSSFVCTHFVLSNTVIILLYSYIVILFYGYMVIGLFGYAVIWSYGYMVIWLRYSLQASLY